MFNVGGGELIVIALIALIVLGPSRLPGAARQVGKTVGELRRLSTGFQNELRAAFDDAERSGEPAPVAAAPRPVSAAVEAVSAQAAPAKAAPTKTAAKRTSTAKRTTPARKAASTTAKAKKPAAKKATAAKRTTKAVSTGARRRTTR
jgi:sec-independent protein translocase protein TatB